MRCAFLYILIVITNSAFAQSKILFVKFSCEGDSIGIIGQEIYNENGLLLSKSETEPINCSTKSKYNTHGQLTEQVVYFPDSNTYIKHNYSYSGNSKNWFKDSIINNQTNEIEILTRVGVSENKYLLLSKNSRAETTLFYDTLERLLYKTICTKIQHCTTYKYKYENDNLVQEEIWSLTEDKSIPFLVQQTNHLYNQKKYLGSIVLNADERCLYHIKKVIRKD